MTPDSKLLFSEAQAFTATGVSTNVVDLGIDQDIGKGEPMTVVVVVTTAADSADGDETYQFALQSDDNDSFSSADELVRVTRTRDVLSAGYLITVPVGIVNQRYLRLQAILGGTTPSVSVTAYLHPSSMVDTASGNSAYAGGYSIA